jgi:hypothetical protein
MVKPSPLYLVKVASHRPFSPVIELFGKLTLDLIKTIWQLPVVQ